MKFNEIQIGDELQVRVEKLLNYKASLGIGDIKGFIHKNEAAWTKVVDISDIMQKDDIITARVIKKIEREDLELLEFTLKKEEENPILKNRDKYKVGNIIEVKVGHIVDYGIGVETEDVSGLIHVSEISWDTNIHPGRYCKVGDKIKAKIIYADEGRGTLSLSMKDVLENPWEKTKEKYNVGDIAEVEIKNLCKASGMGSLILDIPSNEVFAKANLDGEVEVILTFTNFSNTEKEKLVGKIVKAEIIYLNVEKQHIKLNLTKLL